MTKDDFVNAATPLIRQGITLTAGLLAAKGLTAAGNSLEVWAVSGSLLGASEIWALAEKSKLLGGILDAAPASDLDAALGVVQQFRAQGVSPILVAHMAQVASSLAVAELNAAAPAGILAQAPPADAVNPPSPASPGVTPAPVAAEAAEVLPTAEPQPPMGPGPFGAQS